MPNDSQRRRRSISSVIGLAAVLVLGMAFGFQLDLLRRLGVATDRLVLAIALIAAALLVVSAVAWLIFRHYRARLSWPTLPENIEQFRSETFWDEQLPAIRDSAKGVGGWLATLGTVTFATMLVGELALIGTLAVGYLQAQRLEQQNALIQQQTLIGRHNALERQQQSRADDLFAIVSAGLRAPEESSALSEALALAPRAFAVPVPRLIDPLIESSNLQNTSQTEGSTLEVVLEYPNAAKLRVEMANLMRRDRVPVDSWTNRQPNESLLDAWTRWRSSSSAAYEAYLAETNNPRTSMYLLRALTELALPMERRSRVPIWSMYQSAGAVEIGDYDAPVGFDQDGRFVYRRPDLSRLPMNIFQELSMPDLYDSEGITFPYAVDLGGAQLSRVYTEELNAHAARFREALLVRFSAHRFWLPEAEFSHSPMDRCEFRTGTLSFASFTNVSLHDCLFNDVDMIGAALGDFEDRLRISNVDLSLARLSNLSLLPGGNPHIFHRDANLSHVRLRGADLYDIRFVDLVMRGIDLRHATLSNTLIDGSTILSASFDGADLSGLVIRDSTIRNSTFDASELLMADLGAQRDWDEIATTLNPRSPFSSLSADSDDDRELLLASRFQEAFIKYPFEKDDFVDVVSGDDNRTVVATKKRTVFVTTAEDDDQPLMRMQLSNVSMDEMSRDSLLGAIEARLQELRLNPSDTQEILPLIALRDEVLSVTVVPALFDDLQ